MNLRAEGGVSVVGNYVPHKSDMATAKISTALYNRLKDCELGVYWFYGLSAEAKLFKWSLSRDIPNFFNIPLNNRGVIADWHYVPTFSNTRLTRDDDGTLQASTKMSGRTLGNNVGFALINSRGAAAPDYSYALYDYRGPDAEAYATYYNKPHSGQYTLYPLVNCLGIDMIAEPSATLDNVSITYTDANIVSITDRKIYDVGGDYLLTQYTTKVHYIIDITGAEQIDYIKPVIFNNDTWSYSGPKTTAPGNGLYSVTTTLTYDSDADMNWETGYLITLKDGTTITTDNRLRFGGTPALPTVSVTALPTAILHAAPPGTLPTITYSDLKPHKQL